MQVSLRAVALGIGFALSLASTQAETLIDKDLPYPQGEVTPEDIANQVFFVNQAHGFTRYAIVKEGNDIAVVINQPKGRTPTTLTVERYKRNDWNDPSIRSKEVAIFRSGKLRGTGMLITDYEDDSKSQSYSIWLPALRKIRRFAEPPLDDAWGGTDFTFGDVILRKPFHETHELLGKEAFPDCLGAIENVDVKWLPDPPSPSCAQKGREVYKLKSTTKFKNWWYDDRISYVDTQTFADYRIEFFKGGELVKVIDKDWRSAGKSDPRVQFWGYWYGKKMDTGHETWAVVPQNVNRFNEEIKKDDDFWSEKELRKIKR